MGFGGYYLLITKPVQNLIGRRVLSEISKRSNTEIKASQVRLSNFKKLEISDLYVEDENKDTLLYVPKVVAVIDSLNRYSRFVRLKSIELTSPVINISQDDSSTFNFMFIMDSLSNPDKVDSLAWNIEFQSLALQQGQLSLALAHSSPQQLKGLDISAHINQKNIQLEQLSFELNNGFQLKNTYADVNLTPQGIEIPKLSLTSSYSAIVFRDIAAISLNSTLKNTPVDELLFKLQSNNSYISGRDISCFLPEEYAFDNTIVIDGQVDGNLASLKGHNLHLKVDSLIDLNSEFEIKHLNIPKEMSFNVELDELLVDIVASANVFNQMMPALTVDISPYAHWKELVYVGNIAGTQKNFSTVGDIQTRYGTLNTDVSVSLYDSLKNIQYSGKVRTRNFHVGAALQNKKILGDASAQLFVSGGKQADGEFGNYFKGTISSLSIMDYNYSGITLEGGVGKGFFNGNLDVKDKNANFDFNGKVDFLSDEPTFNFTLDMEHFALAKTNITKAYEQLDLSFNLDSKLKGNTVDDVNGFLEIYGLTVQTEHETFKNDSVNFKFKPLDAMPSIVLSSDYINGLILGSYNFSEILGYFNTSLKNHLKLLPQVFSVPKNEIPNDFDFVFEVDDMHSLATTLDLPLRENGFTVISGEIDSKRNFFNLEGDIPYLLTREQVLDSVYISIENDNEEFDSEISIASFIFGGDHAMNNVLVDYNISQDTMQFSTVWKTENDMVYNGDYKAKIWLESIGNNFETVIESQPSEFIIANSDWYLNRHTIRVLPQHITIDSLLFHNEDSYFSLNGIASESLSDTMNFEMDQFRLKNLDRFLSIKKFNFDGILSGQSELYSALKSPVLVTDIKVDSMNVNTSDWGNVTAVTAWDDEASALDLYMDCESLDNADKLLTLSGEYYQEKDSLAVSASLNEFDIRFLTPYLEQTLANLKGWGSGELDVKGSIKDPELYGALKVSNGGFRIDYLSTDFSLNDSIKFDKNRFIFDNTQVQDQEGNFGVVTGDVVHTRYKNMLVDLIIQSDRFMGLNTTAIENEYFFGDIYFGGAITIKSTDLETRIGSRAYTAKGSVLTVPLSPVSTAATNNFIKYIVKASKEDSVIDTQQLHHLAKTTKSAKELIIDMNFNVTTDATLRLEFDAKSGDAIDATGSGDLNIQFQKGQPFQIFGEYEIERGDYFFTLQQIFNKKFNINTGSTLRWSGKPGNAIVDITATYPTRASLYNLMPDAISESSKNRRIPVDVKMFLTERLSQPNISFDIALPNTDAETQQSVSSIINTEEEMSRQVLSLLIMNNFYTPDYYTDNDAGTQTTNRISSAAAVTASEFLSNQLSNWMSQISENLNLGFHYTPEQELTDAGLTPQEYEMAISTQFFNDRLTVNTNMGYQNYTPEARPTSMNSNFVGEVDVELKLNRNLKLKAYSHQNDDILYESTSMKQGAGISYQEEFTTIRELGGRYKRRIGQIFKRKDINNKEAIRKDEDEFLDEDADTNDPPINNGNRDAATNDAKAPVDKE